jgi:hypothetical protein
VLDVGRGLVGEALVAGGDDGVGSCRWDHRLTVRWMEPDRDRGGDNAQTRRAANARRREGEGIGVNVYACVCREGL